MLTSAFGALSLSLRLLHHRFDQMDAVVEACATMLQAQQGDGGGYGSSGGGGRAGGGGGGGRAGERGSSGLTGNSLLEMKVLRPY